MRSGIFVGKYFLNAMKGVSENRFMYKCIDFIFKHISAMSSLLRDFYIFFFTATVKYMDIYYILYIFG